MILEVSSFLPPQSYFGPLGTVKDFDALFFFLVPSPLGSFSLFACL